MGEPGVMGAGAEAASIASVVAAPADAPLTTQPEGLRQLRLLLRGDVRLLGIVSAKIWQATRARIVLRHCTHVGRLVRVVGKVQVKNAGTINIGDRVQIYGDAVRCELVAHEGAVLEIGSGSSMNYGTSISAHQQVRIGQRCLIGTYTNILDNNYHDIVNRAMIPPSKPVIIGDDVWVGGRVIIMPGVTIGDQAVIAAGAVVRENVPARTVVMGNPAQVVARLPRGGARGLPRGLPR